MKLDLSKVCFNYEVIGQGIPVLLIHGFCLDMNVMKGAYEPLFNEIKGFKRIYIDLPAMGHSKEKNGLKSTGEILDCMIAFIDHVLEEERFIVMGQSFGGYIAQAIVNKMPDRVLGLNLLCPLVLANSDERDLPVHELKFDESHLINYEDKEDFEEFMEFAVIANQYTYDRYLTDIIVGFDHATSPVLETIREKNYNLTPEPYEAFKAFDKPCLILVGRQDSAVGYKDVMKLETHLSNLSLHILNGAGHALQYEQVELFNVITLNWLEQYVNR